MLPAVGHTTSPNAVSTPTVPSVHLQRSSVDNDVNVYELRRRWEEKRH